MPNTLKPIPPYAQHGIAVFHNIGDILLCTPIARQLKKADPACHITWYTSDRYAFILENNPDIDEIVSLPADDPETLDLSIDQIRDERAWTSFRTPAPYMNYYTYKPVIVEAGVTLLDLVRESADLQWTVPFVPVVELTSSEITMAKEYCSSLGADGPMILVETEFKSNQTVWDADFALELVESLKDLAPIFVFTSKNRPADLDQLQAKYERIFWCDLPFRANAELFNLCDAFIGVSSGISTLTYSTWCRDDVPRIEVTRGAHWSGFQHLKSRLLFACYTRAHFTDAVSWLRYQLSVIGRNSSPARFSEFGATVLSQIDRRVHGGSKSARFERLNVAFDISVLGMGHFYERARTGIYRVVDNMLRELIDRSEIDLRLVAHAGLLEAAREFVRSTADLNGKYAVDDILSVRERELLHSPFFPLPSTSPVGPRVLTVHDLIPIKFPQFFEFAEGSTIRNTIASIGESDFVTVNSEATKADLCEYAPHIDASRIVVTPLAADPITFYPSLDKDEKYRLTEKYKIGNVGRYLLSVATLEPRKNIAHLIRAFVRLLREDGISDLKLVLVGTKGWMFDGIFTELSLASEIRDQIVVTGFVPDGDMAPLYSNAMAFIYPSLYEGFGLPPLEAMQCGTPVITSDNSSLPEVVGDAGIMLPAQDDDALVAAIRLLYSNEGLRSDMAQRGINRARRFTWSRCVAQTVATYKIAIEHWYAKADQAEAVSHYEQALSLAMQHHQAGRVDQAGEIYRQVLLDAPSNFPATHMLGVVYFQRGDLSASEELLTRAVAMNSLMPEAHYNLGNVYVALGRYADARQCFVQALALNQDFSLARQRLIELDAVARPL